jgi:hypothetical protein
MFCANTRPWPDATTDFGEMVPPTLCTCCNRVVSDGRELTLVVGVSVVVVRGVELVEVGGLVLVGLVELAPSAVVMDVAADGVPLPPARLANATAATVTTHAAATNPTRAPVPSALPGLTTIANLTLRSREPSRPGPGLPLLGRLGPFRAGRAPRSSGSASGR